MKRIILHVTNWVGYYIAIGTLSDLWEKYLDISLKVFFRMKAMQLNIQRNIF